MPPAVAAGDHPAGELVVAEALGTRGLWFPAEPRDSDLAPAQANVTVAPVPGGVEVTVIAEVLLRDLTLLVDKVHPDARVDRGLVTLLPGEATTFRVSCGEPLDAAALTGPGVLRSANQLVIRPPAGRE